MSKQIKADKDYESTIRENYKKFIEDLNSEFEKKMSKIKFTDGKFSITKTFTENFEHELDDEAVVIFTSEAFLKMQTLLNSFDSEVAWHGVAYRREDIKDEDYGISVPIGKHDYVITDILVYPQSVSGTYVDMNVEEYSKWKYENREDSRMKNLRMQGHSHVEMSTSPSSTDLESQKTFVDQLGNDQFYIFMIWNRSLESNIRIYDMRKNILFKSEDITVDINCESGSIYDFVEESKSIVKKITTNNVVKKGSQKPIRRVKEVPDPLLDTPSNKKGWYGYDEYEDEYDCYGWSDIERKIAEHYGYAY